LIVLADLYNHYIRSRVTVTGGGGTGRGTNGYGGRTSYVPPAMPGIIQQHFRPDAVRPWDNLAPEEAYSYSAWYRALTILSQAVSSIAFEPKKIVAAGQYRRQELHTEHPAYYPLAVMANREQTPREFLQTMVWNAVEFGVAFAIIYENKTTSRIELIPVLPTDMWKERDESGLSYVLNVSSGHDHRHSQRLAPGSVVEFSLPQPDGMGPLSPFWSARKSLYEGIQAGKVRAARSSNKGRPVIALTTEEILSDETAARIQRDFGRIHSGIDDVFLPAILDSGLKPHPIDYSPDQQFAKDLWQIPLSDVSNFTGVPTSLLADINAKGADTLEEDTKRFWMYGVDPWAEVITDQYRKRLLTDAEKVGKTAEIGFVRDILKGVSSKSRMEMMRIATGGAPAMVINEARQRFLGEEPLPDSAANKLILPKNMGEDGSVNNTPRDGGTGPGRPKKSSLATKSNLLNASVGRMANRYVGMALARSNDGSKYHDFCDQLHKKADALANELSPVMAVVSPKLDCDQLATELLTAFKERLLELSGSVTAIRDLKPKLEKQSRSIQQSWRRIVKEKVNAQ
jgi:HK97 family phage portal protein